MEAPNPDTLFIGKQVVRLQEVDSTNSYALRMIRNSTVQEGLVIRTDHQTSGRGQRGAEWKDEKGKNLACTIVLKPGFLNPEAQFDLNRAVSLSVTDLFRSYFPHLKMSIKWPNDIYISGKKIGGILIENIISGNTWQYSVVGIGLNLNQEKFPVELPDAISVFQLTGNETNQDEVYNALYSCLEARYLQLKAGNVEKLRSEYEQGLFRKGEETRFTDFKTVFTGKIISVNEEGKLIIEKESGERAAYFFKEIAMILQ